MTEIELGDKVKCKYTGFIGIAVAKTEFINGCIQISVVPKWDGKSTSVDDMGIDENSLEIIKPIRKKVDTESNGGPMRRATQFKGY